MEIGYQAVFYAGEKIVWQNNIRNTHEDAVKDIEDECESVKDLNVNTFTHAKIESIYYRQSRK